MVMIVTTATLRFIQEPHVKMQQLLIAGVSGLQHVSAMLIPVALVPSMPIVIMMDTEIPTPKFMNAL
jgi:hypothetical protein